MVAGPFQEFVSGPVLFSPIVFCCCALSTDTGRKKNKGAQSVFDELGMEWREQSTVSCETAFLEAQRWVEEVTKKRFGSGNFRSALEDGVLLCDLINKLKPGIVKKVNRLSTPIAGLDNVNVFLKACGKLGLREAQLFHPGDLQDLSSRVTVKPEETSRRLKNVLITIYWLGRKAQVDPIYNGPYLNLKAFEGLLGLALSKALEESAAPKAYVRDSGFGDSWYVEKEEQFSVQPSHRRDDSLDSLDSVGSQTLSISSDATLKGSSEGCGSDAEAELGFRMTESKDALHYRRSMVAEPKVATQFNQFLPTRDKAQTGYVPAPLRKKRAERNEVNRLSWASPMYTEDDGTFTRSKSMSDIAVDPGVLRQVRYDELQKIRAQAKDSEDQWQNDLTKWKNRRRSVNSDIVKKKEEREQIEHITSSTGSSRRSKTFKEMQEEREGRGHATPTQNIGVGQDVFPEPVPQPRSRTLPPRSYTVDSLYVSPAAAPAQRDRSPAPTPEPKLDSTPAVKPRSASPAKTSANRASPTSANQADLTSVSQTSPTGTKDAELTGTTLKDQTSTLPSNRTSPAPAPTPADPSSDPPSTLVNIGPAATSKTEESSAGAVSRAPEFKRPFTRAVEEQSSGSLYKHNSMDTKPAAARVSASLPRSYQRLDSARLTSVVTARPFGTQSTRIASLPRTFAIEDSHKRLNGETGPRKPAVPSLYSQFMTEDEARTQASQAQSSNEDEDEEEEEEEEQQETVAPAAPLSSGDGTRPDPVSTLDLAPKLDDAQELFCDMRISLNQKPNSSRDFGFQANWDSTGAFIKSVQEGSPAELCQLRAGDEVLAVSGHKVSEMSYEQWKGSLDAALQKGCLVMDVRRHGNNGAPEKYINICREFAPRPSSETAAKATDTSGQPVNDLTSKGVNGGFRDESVTMRNKESEPISLKNLKRRSEFFEQQGGSESPLSDLQVPSIGTSSNRWSWDPEDERRRQEKWQRDQERLLQEKYKRDQEKMDEEWRRAQQEAQEEESRVREMVQKATETDSRSLSPYSPVSPLNQAPSPPWAEPACRDEEKEEEEEEEERREAELEEMRRRERQEQLQREEEEEEKERQRRAEEARLQRKREAELEEMKRREEEEEERQRRAEEMRLQRKREAELQEQRRLDEEEMKRREEEMKRREEEMKRHQEAADEQRRFEEEQQERIQEQWAGESYGFAKILPEISASDRAKSKSTPELDEADKDQGRVVNSGGASDSSWRKPGQPGQPPLSSQAESERQQILEEMKKKTHLLTDSSWIRQRSASVNKEPANPPAGGGVRRGESLDNLDADRSWTTPSWSSGNPSYSRPHSAASAHGYTRPASCTLPTSYSTGSLRQQSAWAPPAPVSPTSPTAVNEDPSPEPSQQRGRSVSGKKICTFCDSPLGKGAAMIIESLGLCYHLGCFKCIDCKSDLGGSESGAEVRIRNRQLYCNACYVRFKTGQPTSM